MTLASGSRLGAYEIGSLLGSGGMGEVYRAQDTKLNRDVALKVLPELFALDPDRLARFKREAQVLASLNHPNIAAIYGFEESDGVRALVLELVEGLTLADVIARARGSESGSLLQASAPSRARGATGRGSPEPERAQRASESGRGWGPGRADEGGAPRGLGIDEALPIARQICEALQAANERGVIHRDLKPANIKITPAGNVKVLDFGLAKALSDDAAADVSNSPTMTAMATRAGVIIGTAAYMAPEQARGKDVDKRTDIWAFGCVLYEMLTGKRAFPGDDVSDTLATVLKSEPEWSALPPDVPPAIRTLIQRCLEKDRNRRVADISTALFLINEPATLAPPVGGTSAPTATVRPPAWRRVATHTLAVLAASAVVGTVVWFAARSSVPPARVSRLLIAPSSTAALSINGVDRDLAITPDGSRIVYVGNNGTQLFVHALDALEPVAIFKGDPRGPFVSPDGQWVGFIDSNTTLKRVAISGGPAVTVAPMNGTIRGATWAPDDTILFATTNLASGLQRVAAGGGTPTVLTRADRGHGELDHLWPEMLRSGRAVLFTITAQTGGLDAAQVAVLDLQSGTHKVLVRGGSHAHYVSSGHLVYAAAGSLRAVGFDPTRLETPIPAPPRPYLYPQIAPDGMRLALGIADREIDIWLWDLARATLTRVTFDPAVDLYPVWTTDGRRLIFSSERTGVRNLFWQAADGTGAVERLTESPNAQSAAAVSPDGKHLIFWETVPKTGNDVMQVQLDGTHLVTPLVQTPFTEQNGAISPDGRWLAYEANDSGQAEIYVRPFPEVNSGHWQVSTAGGTRPLWARNGQELFYLTPSGAVMRVGVELGQTWAATPPTKLLNEGYFTVPGGNPGRTYDISPDGQRFLMIKQGGGSDQTAAPTSIVVVQNWGEELKRLVPTK